MFSMQQVFDIVITWIIAQHGEHCSGSDGACKYRASSANYASTRCVIGLFMTEQEFDEFVLVHSTQSCGVSSMEYKQIPVLLRHVNREFLIDLQYLHDSKLDKEDRRRQMKAIAKKWELNDTVISLY